MSVVRWASSVAVGATTTTVGGSSPSESTRYTITPTTARRATTATSGQAARERPLGLGGPGGSPGRWRIGRRVRRSLRGVRSAAGDAGRRRPRVVSLWVLCVLLRRLRLDGWLQSASLRWLRRSFGSAHLAAALGRGLTLDGIRRSCSSRSACMRFSHAAQRARRAAWSRGTRSPKAAVGAADHVVDGGLALAAGAEHGGGERLAAPGAGRVGRASPRLRGHVDAVAGVAAEPAYGPAPELPGRWPLWRLPFAVDFLVVAHRLAAAGGRRAGNSSPTQVYALAPGRGLTGQRDGLGLLSRRSRAAAPGRRWNTSR